MLLNKTKVIKCKTSVYNLRKSKKNEQKKVFYNPGSEVAPVQNQKHNSNKTVRKAIHSVH